MKKKRSRIGGLITSIFNLRAWGDFDRTRSIFVYLKQTLFKLFVPQQKKTEETFNQALKRLKINKEDLINKQHALLRLSIIMLSMAIFLFGYFVYQLLYGMFFGVLLSLIVTLIALVLAFRYHFWYFQIKQRKLGCSLYEWFRVGILGAKQ